MLNSCQFVFKILIFFLSFSLRVPVLDALKHPDSRLSSQKNIHDQYNIYTGHFNETSLQSRYVVIYKAKWISMLFCNDCSTSVLLQMKKLKWT